MKPVNKKGKHFLIPLVVYPYDVFVSIGESDSAVIKALDEFTWSEKDLEELMSVVKLPANCKGRSSMTSEGARLVLRLPMYPETEMDHGFLAHEIFHIVHFLFHRIGMKLTMSSGEAYAYLIGHITGEIYKRI
jgi:hypothetical protein